MAQIYKVFNETKPLILHNIPLYLTDQINFIYIKVESAEDCQFLLDVFWDFSDLNGVSAYCSEIDIIWEKFKSKFKIIKAAGGIVTDPKNNLLVIKRNGFLDLPKGHFKNKESASQAAIREVAEECGIKSHIIIENNPIITYHVYELDGEKVLKETQWFKMRSNNQESLKPQKEEGIEEALWMSKSEINQKINEFYPSLLDLLGAPSQ